AAGTDQAGQHHHRQRQQNALIDAHQQCGPCSRNLDLEQDGARACAQCRAQLAEFLWNLLERQCGDAHHRRRAVDDGGDDGRHAAEAEDDDGRNQINPRRHRLHDIEHRPESGLDSAQKTLDQKKPSAQTTSKAGRTPASSRVRMPATAISPYGGSSISTAMTLLSKASTPWVTAAKNGCQWMFIHSMTGTTVAPGEKCGSDRFMALPPYCCAPRSD